MKAPNCGSPGHPGKLLPEVKAQWLKALRSGQYPQGIGCLLFKGHYCCLGVLAEERGMKWARREGSEDERMYLLSGDITHIPLLLGGAERYSILIPNAEAEKLGLTMATQNTLSCMNDRGDSFGAIADWIEREL